MRHNGQTQGEEEKTQRAEMKEGGVAQVQVCQKLQEINIQTLSYAGAEK